MPPNTPPPEEAHPETDTQRAQPETKGAQGLPFSLFLALRYLKPKRTFLSVITLISILGVVLGVTVLILVIAVMTGFDRELRRKVIGFDAHLTITNGNVLYGWEELAEKATSMQGITAAAPFVMGPVIAEFDHRRTAPKIRGIDAEAESRVTDLEQHIIAGALDLDGDSAVLGSELAGILGAWVGDTITIYSPGNLDAILNELDKAKAAGGEGKTLDDLRELVLPATLIVSGIFESGRYEFDSEFLLVPLHIGQELYALGPGVHGLSLKTVDPYRAPEFKEIMTAKLAPPAIVTTWIDQNSQLFDAIRLERSVMFFLLLFIIIVAAFGIMNTLITVTVQKTRDIGVMKALGAATSQIVWVFLAQGMVVGAFGTGGGLLLGMTLVRYRNHVSQWLANVLGIEIFPRQVYQFSEIPAEIVPHDVAIICISAFAICSLAALIPAYAAARLDPVKALRYD